MLRWLEWLEWLLVNFTLLFRGEFPEGMFFLNQEQNFRPGNRHWNDLRDSLVRQGIAEKTPCPDPIQEDVTNEKGVLKMFYNLFLRENVETLPVRANYTVTSSTLMEENESTNSPFHRAVRESLARYKVVYERATSQHQTPFDKGQLRIIQEHLSILEERINQTKDLHADIPLLEYCARLGGQWFPFPYGHTIFSRDPYGYAKFCVAINDHVKAVGRGELCVYTAGILNLQERSKSLEEQVEELRSKILSISSESKQEILRLGQETTKLKEDVESVRLSRTSSISSVRSTVFYHDPQNLEGPNESHPDPVDISTTGLSPSLTRSNSSVIN